MYKENDNINVEERNKYKSMSSKDRDELLKKLETEEKKKMNK